MAQIDDEIALITTAYPLARAETRQHVNRLLKLHPAQTLSVTAQLALVTAAYPSNNAPFRRLVRTLLRTGGVSGGGGTPAFDPMFVRDTFTGSDGTALTARTGEVGADWSQHPGSAGTAAPSLLSNRLRAQSDNEFWFASGAAGGPDYYAETSLHVASTGGSSAAAAGPCVRMDATATTMYEAFYFYSTSKVELYKIEAGAYTNLASYPVSISPGDTLVIRLNVSGAVITVSINGDVQVPITDTGISAAGKTGFVLGDTAASDTTWLHLDTFLARTAVTSTARKQVVFDGNSMTDKAYSSYPQKTMILLGEAWDWHNFGVSGQTTAQMSADASTQIDTLFNASQYSDSQVLVAWEIRNQAIYGGVSVAQCLSDYVAYCQARRAAGWGVVAVTCLPASDFPEADRTTINTYLRANWATFSDILADIAADTNIGLDGQYSNHTYYQDDGIHMLPAGYAVVAQYVADAVGMAA